MTSPQPVETITVPDLGDFHDVDVIEVLVKAGDVIPEGASLITLETDKAAMDVPAPKGGTVRELHVKTGDKVSRGSPVLTLEISAEAGPSAAKSAPVITPPPKPEPPPEAASPARTLSASPVPAPPARSALESIAVPDLGDFHDVDVIEVLVKAGDVIPEGASLITLETDKAAMDVPAPKGGTVRELHVKTGDKVSRGSPILTLETLAEARPSAERPTGKLSHSTTAPAPSVTVPPSDPNGIPTGLAGPASGGRLHPYAGPLVRKLARELGVNLDQVSGSGTRGRIRPADVKSFVRNTIRPGRSPAGGEIPAYDYARFGPVERQPLSRIQKIAGPRLSASWNTIPHVTQHDQADITELDRLRVRLNEGDGRRLGVKLTLLPFLMKAAVQALREHPTLNASLNPDLETLTLKKYYHLGFAVDTPQGLVVPVLQNVDQKDLWTLAHEMTNLADKARQGRLAAADFQGGTFTLSSLGGIGGTAFTPIINAPEVAILGISRAEIRPVWSEGAFVPRLRLPLSLSYDHRVIDGALAVRFTRSLAQAIETFSGILPPPP
jgi:pyruvate dehydrogenase E2 component (dihydrolipoamide acetyltransferase)